MAMLANLFVVAPAVGWLATIPLSAPGRWRYHITVDLTEKHQTMDDFGASEACQCAVQI